MLGGRRWVRRLLLCGGGGCFRRCFRGRLRCGFRRRGGHGDFAFALLFHEGGAAPESLGGDGGDAFVDGLDADVVVDGVGVAAAVFEAAGKEEHGLGPELGGGGGG